MEKAYRSEHTLLILRRAYTLVRWLLVVVSAAPFVPIMLYGRAVRDKLPSDLIYAYLPLFLLMCAVFLFLRGCFAIVGTSENDESSVALKVSGGAEGRSSSLWSWAIAITHWSLALMFTYFSVRLIGAF